jgi:hypothetical protein
MKTAVTILMLGLTVGCASRKDQKPWTDPAAWKPGTPIAKESVYPDDNESALTDAQNKRLEQLRRDWRPVAVITPFDADPVLRALYLDWYAKGYTFFEASGMQIIPPYNQPDSKEQRVKAAGWGAGELAARLKAIDQVFEKLGNGKQDGAAHGSQPFSSETNRTPAAAGSRR